MGYDDPQLKEFENYYIAKKAGLRERAENWAVAIGLQQVDGLRPSKYLIEIAKKHIEGEISDVEATSLVDKYYESKVGHDAPEDEKEADRVAARINEVIGDDGFNFSPSYLIGLHGLIFEGVFPHAGSIREVNLRKREWVLRGESVTYGHAPMIERTLDYDFDREREYSYADGGKRNLIAHFARFIAGIWQIHPFREGNTRTTAVFAIKYLRSMKINATNDLFAENSWFFRNALVRANYEDPLKGIHRDFAPLERFFESLILGRKNNLQNRYLLVGLTEDERRQFAGDQEKRSEKGGQKKAVRKEFHDPTSNPASNPTSNDASKGSGGLNYSPQVRRLLSILEGEQTRAALMKALNLKDRVTFLNNYLGPCLKIGLVEMTQPNSPRSPTQRYRLTESGLRAKLSLAEGGRS